MPGKIMDSGLDGWTPDRLDDLTGRRSFITGGNAGLGFETAKFLRAASADVIIGCRSATKADAAVAELEMLSGAGSVGSIPIDLADTGSIRAGVDQLRETVDGLDAIVNNAGVMQTPQRETADGFELQFGTNHLGHFLMNQLAFDLVAARGGRIVPVSSVAHLRGDLHFDDVMLTTNYSPTRAYSQSKLADLVYGLELARRLEAAGSDVTSVTAHPGYAATNLQSTGPTGLMKVFYKFTNAVMAQPAEKGAVPLVLAAAGDGVCNGGYYGPTSMGGARGPVGDAAATDTATDPENGRRLWELSEELLGIEFEI